VEFLQVVAEPPAAHQGNLIPHKVQRANWLKLGFLNENILIEEFDHES
jgi:hypothetical protein